MGAGGVAARAAARCARGGTDWPEASAAGGVAAAPTIEEACRVLPGGCAGAGDVDADSVASVGVRVAVCCGAASARRATATGTRAAPARASSSLVVGAWAVALVWFVGASAGWAGLGVVGTAVRARVCCPGRALSGVGASAAVGVAAALAADARSELTSGWTGVVGSPVGATIVVAAAAVSVGAGASLRGRSAAAVSAWRSTLPGRRLTPTGEAGRLVVLGVVGAWAVDGVAGRAAARCASRSVDGGRLVAPIGVAAGPAVEAR